MAHLIRPWISYYTKNGKRVPKGTKGAKRVKQRARKWYAAGLPGWPKGRRKPLCADKTTATRMLAKLIHKAEREAAGLVSPEEEHAKTPIESHLEDFERYLTAKGGTAKHVRETMQRCRAAIAGIGASRLHDLTPSAVVEWIATLRQPPAHVAAAINPRIEWYTKAELAALLGIHPGSLARMLQREGLQGEGNGKARRFSRAVAEALHERLRRGNGISTANHYCTALKSFTRWLSRDRRLNADPLIGVSKQNEEPDVRVVRRSLSPTEFAAFIEATRQGKTFRGLSGADRAMLYQLAARSGLRASEIASLTPESFDWSVPSVTVKAAYSKRRRRDEQPLPQNLAAALKDYLKGRPKDKPIWQTGWVPDAAEMIRHDLAAAGIAYVDGEGSFDFHALRHQYVSDLVASGAHPRDAQTLARHSTITLTMNRYAHPRQANLHAALGKLPDLTAENSGGEDAPASSAG